MDATVNEGPGKTYFIRKISIMETEEVVIKYGVKLMLSPPTVQHPKMQHSQDSDFYYILLNIGPS